VKQKKLHIKLSLICTDYIIFEPEQSSP